MIITNSLKAHQEDKLSGSIAKFAGRFFLDGSAALIALIKAVVSTIFLPISIPRLMFDRPGFTAQIHYIQASALTAYHAVKEIFNFTPPPRTSSKKELFFKALQDNRNAIMCLAVLGIMAVAAYYFSPTSQPPLLPISHPPLLPPPAFNNSTALVVINETLFSPPEEAPIQASWSISYKSIRSVAIYSLVLTSYIITYENEIKSRVRRIIRI